jgi:hypothetical protein
MLVQHGRKRDFAMVDRLRSSLENLHPPACPRCRTEMAWFESRLVEREPTLIIEHNFACATCGGFSARRNEAEATPRPPALRLAYRPHRMAA